MIQWTASLAQTSRLLIQISTLPSALTWAAERKSNNQIKSLNIYRTVKRNFFPLRRLDCKDLVVVLVVELHGLDVVKDGLEVSLQEMLTSDLY